MTGFAFANDGLIWYNGGMQPAVYILSNQHNTATYIGVTGDLYMRITTHKNRLVKGFSKRYNLDKLVYVELHDDMESAILREKRLKNWRPEWKADLIERDNPGWEDISHLLG